MKTGSRIVAAALVGALSFATSAGLSAAESWSMLTMKPLMAASFDAGGKHLVSYFVNADGLCKLTVMVADSLDESPQATQLQLSVEPGRTARLATADGKTLRFVCLGRAEAMSATALSRVAAKSTE